MRDMKSRRASLTRAIRYNHFIMRRIRRQVWQDEDGTWLPCTEFGAVRHGNPLIPTAEVGALVDELVKRVDENMKTSESIALIDKLLEEDEAYIATLKANAENEALEIYHVTEALKATPSAALIQASLF